MTSEQAQLQIIHWLISSFWIHKREEICQRIPPELFDEPYRNIYKTHLDFFKEKRPISEMDWDVLMESMKEKYDYGPFNLDEMIEIISMEKLQKVAQQELGNSLRNLTNPKEILGKLETALENVYKTTSISEKTDIRSVLDEVLELEGNAGWGIPTGYKSLDELTGGLRKSAFWIVGGYANTGKTGFVVRMASYLCGLGKRVAFYSLEMDRASLGKKLVDYVGIKTENPYDVVVDYKLDIINSKRTVEAIESHVFQNKPDVVIIDYLHLLSTFSTGKEASEYDKVTAISGRLKNLAGSTGIPVVALSQISNESAKRQSLEIMGFKGSGALAFDCDVGITLRRDFEKEHQMKLPHVSIYIILQKNRYGKAPDTIEMSFNKETGFIL